MIQTYRRLKSTVAEQSPFLLSIPEPQTGQNPPDQRVRLFPKYFANATATF